MSENCPELMPKINSINTHETTQVTQLEDLHGDKLEQPYRRFNYANPVDFESTPHPRKSSNYYRYNKNYNPRFRF